MVIFSIVQYRRISKFILKIRGWRTHFERNLYISNDVVGKKVMVLNKKRSRNRINVHKKNLFYTYSYL